MPSTSSVSSVSFRSLIGVLLAMVLFAAACGGAADEASVASGASDVTATSESPTEVPPTEVPPTEVVEPTNTPIPDPTSTPAPTATPEPEPEPTATPEPEPTVESAEAALPVSGTTDDEFDACVSASPLFGTPLQEKFDGLKDPSGQDVIDTLTADEMTTVAQAMSDCGAAAGFVANMGLDGERGAEVTACVDGTLQGEDGGSFMVGLVAVGSETSVPESQRTVFVEQMNTCVGPDVFADVMVAMFGADPETQGLMDLDCVRERVLSSDILSTMWAAMAEDPVANSFNDLGEELGENELMACISMGGVIALAAAEDGVQLTPETIACIDTEIENQDLIAQMESGEVDESAISIVMLTCMTPEELAAMGS